MDYWKRVELELGLAIILTLPAMILSTYIGNKIYTTISWILLLGENILARYYEKKYQEYLWRTG